MDTLSGIDNSKGELSKSLVEVVNEFVLPKNLQIPLDQATDTGTGFTELQTLTQEAYEQHYKNSGMADQVDGLRQSGSEDLDSAALGLVSDLASRGEGAWIATFPNLRKPDSGMDCTMAAAMLTLSLKDLGYENVHTVLRSGHYEVMRDLGDGKIKLYDPATRVTGDDGITRGYEREFDGVKTGHDQSGGLKFEIQTDEPDYPGGIRDKKDGKYTRKFYAFGSGVLVDLAIVLENLDSMKTGAEGVESEDMESPVENDVWKRQASEISREHGSSLKNFDYQKLKDKLKFLDPYSQIK